MVGAARRPQSERPPADYFQLPCHTGAIANSMATQMKTARSFNKDAGSWRPPTRATPPPPPTQTCGADLPRRFCIIPAYGPTHPFQMPALGTNVQHWLPETSPDEPRFQCLRVRRLPRLPGFISSTSKPANFSARTDAAASGVPARTRGRWLKFTFVLFPRERILPQCVIGSGGWRIVTR